MVNQPFTHIASCWPSTDAAAQTVLDELLKNM
jgi:hypothetical protein